MAVPAPAYSTAELRAAVQATYGAFIGAGFAFASWSTRIPQVRDRLHLTPADLGLVLLSLAIGSAVALPISPLIIARLGTRRTVVAMAGTLAVGLSAIGLGCLANVIPVLIGLFLFGFANGAWDVAMNVQGADVEQHLRRAIMSRFHAGFSVGTVGGALIGAAMVALRVPVSVHFLAVAALVGVIVPILVRGFLPDSQQGPRDRREESPAQASIAASALARWTEPRTLLIGVFVLAFAFAEGTGNDWISVAMIDGYGASAVTGALCFAAFLCAMTVTRWLGPGLLDRHGRVIVVRALAGIAVLGLLVFVFSPSVPLAFVGALLWGAGTSLGFPVGMSAAADEPAAAAARVSVVASIGYCAFLAGPPLIGFLGARDGVLRALTAVAVLLAVATMVAGSLRPIGDEPAAP